MKPYILTLLIGLMMPLAAKANLSLVAALSDNVPPGNIAVSAEGRIFFSVHEFYGQPLKVVELLKDGTTRPYPNAQWSVAPAPGKPGLNGVLGLNVDNSGILWLLDGATADSNARLVGWNIHTESLHRVIYLGFPITRSNSFVNDLAIDTTHQAIYITDVASPDNAALIVVDLKTGLARRVLEGSTFTRPEDIDMVIEQRVIALGGNPARIGANPISIDPQHQWVYFGAMNGTAVYRVNTRDLLNPSLSDEALAAKVQRYGDKPISDGITIDNAGNVYITSITDNSIGVTQANGQYKPLYTDATLSWPDGFAIGPNNTVYVTINELHRSPVLNNGENAATGKFAIYRFPALAPATTGR